MQPPENEPSKPRLPQQHPPAVIAERKALRDEFAKFAIQNGVIETRQRGEVAAEFYARVAREAYAFADAMLKARGF